MKRCLMVVLSQTIQLLRVHDLVCSSQAGRCSCLVFLE